MQGLEEKPQLAAEGKDPASDEEIARRLQQQLNGEAAAAARRRTRKQPTFYSPQVLHCFITPASSPPPLIQDLGSGSAHQHTHLHKIQVSCLFLEDSAFVRAGCHAGALSPTGRA